MSVAGPTSWVRNIRAGEALLVTKHARLWPLEMWSSPADDGETILVDTPIIKPGDICGVLDTLSENGAVYAALVVCSEGVGCVIADADYLKPL